MPRAEKHDIRKHNRETHSPYTQSGRKVKKTSTGSWSPSIWNILTFWKSADASHEEEDEEDEYDGDVSTGHDETSINHNITFDEDGDHNMSPLNISNLSEEQVVASLTHAPRHVHFQLPNSDHERLDRSQSTTETPVRRGRNSAYVAPLPPSSPLNQSGSPLDPLAKVSEYLDTVVRPRGGECTDVEALGLSVLIQSSVNQSGMRHASPSNLSPFLRSNMSLGSNPVSSSPSPIRPMFTNRSTDIDAVMASSSGASAARTSASNTPSTSSPARTLAQNPNGSLYYQGGGSSRSRYRSPAFGSPGRNKVTFPRHFGEGKKDSSPMNGATQTPSPSDAKRRRVGEEKDSSVELASGSHPVTPNGISTPQHAPVTSTPRFGTSAPASHLLTSTPARPSPLRQSVRADSISPASSTAGNANGGSPRSGPSPSDSEGRSRASEKASEIMAGIIKDATPKDTVPDVRNPYQPTRVSTKRSRMAATKAPRPPPRPTRQSNGTPSSLAPKKLSALETIQSTAPQAQTGSKRSHTGMPPPKSSAPVNGKGNPTAPIQTGSNAVKTVTVEVVEDEDELRGPPSKKQKSELSQPSTEKNVEVDAKAQTNTDIEDVDMEAAVTGNVSRPSEVIEPDQETKSQEAQTQQQQEVKRPVFTGPFGKGVATTRFQSTPKEPSPLRQSFQPGMAPPSPPQNPASSASSSASASPLVSTSSPFAQTFASSPASVPAPSPSASTATPSPFTSALAPSPFASTSAPSSFGSTSAPSPFTSALAPSPFASTSAPSPFGSTSAPSPFGSTSAPSPFGSTSAPSHFGSTSAPSPFGSTSAPSPFTSALAPSPFASTSAPSPFGSTSAPSPFVSTSAPSPFASTSAPSPFTQAAASSAVTTAVVPSPFGSMSTSPFAPKSAPSPFSVSLANSSPQNNSLPSTDDTIAAPPNPAVPVPPTSTPLGLPPASTDMNIDLVSLAKKQVLEVPVSSLPTFAFAFTTNTSFLSEHAEQRDLALAVPTTELPKFDFVGKPVPAPVTAPALALVPQAEVKAFNWDAVGMSRPTSTGWTCGLCSCRNKEGSTKCSVCDEIKP